MKLREIFAKRKQNQQHAQQQMPSWQRQREKQIKHFGLEDGTFTPATSVNTGAPSEGFDRHSDLPYDLHLFSGNENDDGEGGLAMEDFVAAFGQAFQFSGSGDGTGGKERTRQDLENIFMKIDANSDGTVDWDEFTNFILLLNQGAQNMRNDEHQSKHSLHSMTPDPSVLMHMHKEMIGRIVMVDKPQPAYVTCSKDGTLRFWKCDTLQHIRTIANVSDYNLERKQRAPAWISDIAVMSCCNKLAVAAVDRSLSFYDLSTFELSARITDLQHAPMSLAYCRISDDYCNLMVGDTRFGPYIPPLPFSYFQFLPAPLAGNLSPLLVSSLFASHCLSLPLLSQQWVSYHMVHVTSKYLGQPATHETEDGTSGQRDFDEQYSSAFHFDFNAHEWHGRSTRKGDEKG
jgi:hypothetical protein